VYRICVDRGAAHAQPPRPALVVYGDELTAPVRAWEARIDGPSAVVWRPWAPLPNGAVIWVETEGPLELDLDPPEAPR
jgi:hypothetical protein